MPSRLTNLAIERLRAPRAARAEIRDALVPGLVLRVTHQGRKSWLLTYRVRGDGTPTRSGVAHGIGETVTGRLKKGKLRRIALGAFPALGVAEARQKAQSALELADQGIDPAVDRAQQVAERRESRANTFEAVATLYTERYRKKRNRASTVRDAESVLRRLVHPRWGAIAIADLKRRDVIALLDDTVAEASKPEADFREGAANRVLREVRAIFKWAIERGLIENNPASKIRMPIEHKSRDRVLSDAELRVVLRAAEHLGYPFGSIIQVLALTGQRRDEVAQMRWRDLRLTGDEPLWTLPREVTKANREHSVPLAPEVVEILNNVPRLNEEFVFAGQRNDRPVSGFAKRRRALDKKIEELCDGQVVGNWRIHDLRRTAASGMARLGVQPVVLARILNHAPGSVQGVTAIYNRHNYASEMRHALKLWATHVRAILSDEMSAPNVVQLPARN